MPSTPQEIPLTFEKGLVLEVEDSVLDTGQASELTNWEPTPNGSLRTRNIYSEITTLGLTAPYNTRGWGSIATGTAASVVTGPQIAQSEHWPNGDADPVSTKTLTLNGCSPGNTIIAVVSVNSTLSPTVTVGFTERAVGADETAHVKIYTKTATVSTEAFTYTIATSQIRAVSLFEVRYLQSEDPGSNWAAADKNGAAGSDALTITSADTDGLFALIGYEYDGGVPDTGDSGTSGWTTPTLRNQNSRTGVTFQDLDNIDVSKDQTAASSVTLTTASWTPPATGVILCMLTIHWSSAAGHTLDTLSFSGNGLTWHDALDGGELGVVGLAAYATHVYGWVDCASAVGTTGAITITATTGSGSVITGASASFVLGIGADTADPFVQQEIAVHGSGVIATSLSPLLDGSGVIGCANTIDQVGNDAPIPTIAASKWQAQADQMDIDQDPQIGVSYIARDTSAYVSSNFPPDASQEWTLDGGGISYTTGTWEIKGAGNAGQIYSGTATAVGTVIENFSYVLNKQMTAKMAVWGYAPPSVSADTVDFYIVLAVATDSTTYKVYRIGRNEITSGTWELIDTVTDALSTDAFVTFAQGAGNLLWSATPMTQPRVIELATLTPSNVSDL